MPQALVLKYVGRASGTDYDWWREAFCRQVLNCDIEPHDRLWVDSTIKSQLLPRINITEGTGTPQRSTAIGKSGELVLVVPKTAAMQVKAGSRSVEISNGHVSLGDASRQGNGLTRLTTGSFLAVIFDRKLLTEAVPSVEHRLARDLTCDPHMLSLFIDYCAMLQEKAGNLSAEALQAAGQHLLDLAAIMLKGEHGAMSLSEGVVASRIEAAKTSILARLDDPTLSIEDLARQQRVSVRYLQLLFQREGTSFIEFLVDQRLLLARRLLASSQHGLRKIADIALMAGYANLSNFNRAYRRRFGETPSNTRERMRSGEP